jgi:hypothetical protein
VLASEIENDPVKLPISAEDRRPLQVKHVRLVGEWLQLGLEPAPRL